MEENDNEAPTAIQTGERVESSYTEMKDDWMLKKTSLPVFQKRVVTGSECLL